MRFSVPRLTLSLLVLLSAANAFATCPPTPSGPYLLGFDYYYDYTPDRACWSASGNVGYATACGYDGFEWGTTGYTVSTITYEFEIGAYDPVGNSWTADADVYFDDPNNNSNNIIAMTAIVNHNGSNSIYPLFAHDGTDGDLSCARPWGGFDATNGDIVTIEIAVTKVNSNTTIRAKGANIFTGF
jgi:hypothetical protein